MVVERSAGVSCSSLEASDVMKIERLLLVSVVNLS